MALQNLTGKWIGQYNYGKGYGPELAGQSVPLTIEIKDSGHIITGSCIDDETKDIFHGPATIEGAFDKNYISFIKKYPYRVEFDENSKVSAFQDDPSAPIHYTGTLRKMLFSGKYVFRGEWEITGIFKDENDKKFHYTSEGTWSMKRED